LDQIGSTVPTMAAPRNLTALKDEESGMELEDDSPTSKKPKSEKFPLNSWEFAVAVAVFFIFSTALFCIYLTMPATTSANLKLPRTLSDLRTLKYFPPFSPFSISYKNSFFLGFCLIGIKITCFVLIYVW
jgi:hypothetical protein